MDDDRLNRLTAPTVYANIAPSMQAGLTVSGAMQVPRRHRCGRCATPFTSSGGNDDCPNNKERADDTP